MNYLSLVKKDAGKDQQYWREILTILPPNLRLLISSLPQELLFRLEELRLRRGRPLVLGIGENDYFIDVNGKPGVECDNPYLVSEEDLERALQMVSGSSFYALEEELKNGFITISGGHRVGITGRVVMERGAVKTIKHFSGMNIRVSREVLGAADELMPHIVRKETGTLYHTMIFSPPGCGKTTILRDVIRQISNGIPCVGFKGVTVGLVDERSELAGCYRGVPQRDVGVRTDVLDGCPKAEGMLMLLRSMAPQVIATDEIGRREDVHALEEVLNAGVKVIFTVHGSSLQELSSRPALDYLFKLGVVERYIQLSRSRGVGTVERIWEGKNFSPGWR